ncbi:MAG: PAS domain S-box protein [Thermoanaerobaculia bacterium]
MSRLRADSEDTARVVRLCGALTAGFGSLALLGWAAGLHVLASLGSERIPMAPSTALLFVAYGIAAYLRGRRPRDPAARRAGVAVNSAGALIATLLLILSLAGIRPTAELLGLSPPGAPGGLAAGHMSPVAAICFVLASLSFFASLPSPVDRPGRAALARWTAGLLLAISCILLLAYLFGSPLLYGGSFVPPAATTGLAFATLATALVALARRPARAAERAVEPLARIPLALVLAFALLAAGIVTAGGFHLRSEGRRYRAEVERQLAAVAQLKTSELELWRAERLGDASVFLGNAPFAALVGRLLGDPPEPEARAQLRDWLTRVQTHYGYDRICLIDARGAERLAVPESRSPESPLVVRRLPETLRSAEVIFQDFYRDERDDRVYLSLLAPVRDDAGRALGVVALRIDPETYLYPFVARWPTPARTAETLLVRRDGNDALFLSALRFRQHAALALRVPLANRDVVAVKAALGEEGIVEGLDYRGVPVIAALQAVPGSPWSLVARTDAAEVNAPLRQRLREMIVLVCGMLAAAAAGVGLVWRGRHIRDLRERYAAEQERAWLHDVVARSLNEVYVFDPDTLRFRFANRGACRNLGYTPEQLTGLTPLDLKPEFSEKTFRALLQPLLAADRPQLAFETLHRRKDGSEYPVEVHLQLVDSGGAEVFLSVINDITERRRAEARIRQLNRILAVASEVNQAVVRLREPRALFAEVCRIAVETGGFRMAWIGLLDEKTRLVRPVAQAGVTDGFLEQLQGARGGSDGPPGLGPAAGLPRASGHDVCNDIGGLPGGAPWRDAALARGFRAAAAFPLTAAGETIGSFALYGGEPGLFDAEELQLLDDLARDLSFAIEVGELEKTRLRLATAIEQSPISVMVTDPEGRIEYVNPAFTSATGYTPEEAVGANSRMLSSGRHDPGLYRQLWATILAGENWHGELVNRRKDGDLRLQALTIAPVRDAAGKVSHFVAIGQDVTESREADQALHLARFALDHSADINLWVDREARLVNANETALRQLGYTREELLGMKIWQVALGESPAAWPASWESDRQAESVIREDTFRRRDGSEFLVEVVVTHVAFGGVELQCGIARDITVRKQAEQAVRESEIRLRRIVDNIHDALYVDDADGKVVFANDRFLSLFGVERDQLPCLELEDYVAPEWRAVTRDRHERRLRGEAVSSQFEYEGLRQDGRRIWLESMVVPLLDDAGRVVGTQAADRDITERKQAEASLRASEERFRSVCESASIGLYRTTPDGRILMANPAAVRMLGYDSFEELARRDLESAGFEPAYPRSEFRERLEGDGIIAGIESEWRRRDGSRIFVRESARLVRDENGASLYYDGTFEDITERKRAEASLRASESRYRSLFDNNLAGVYRSTIDGRLLECNEAFARIYGFASRAEALGDSTRALYPTPVARDAFVAELAASRVLVNRESEGRRKDGSAVWLLENARLVEDVGGTEGTVIEGTLLDITDRKNMESELRQSQKIEAIGRLAGGVAHDFNNILGVILGYGELAQLEVPPESPVRELVTEMVNAAQRAAALTRQLQAFSRKQILQPRRLDLNALVAETRKMLERVIGEDVELLVRPAPDLGTVRADPGQVEQVLLNLAVNARDAMPQGGTLTIETANLVVEPEPAAVSPPVTPGSYVMLAVSDTGVGMDAETQRRVFEPFFTTKPVGQGTGLGLATVYGIVKQSGGYIWVHSKVGRGATFKIYLPRVDEPAEALVAATPSASLPEGRETILLVEDNSGLREFIRRRLETSGYTVLVAPDGEGALALAEAQSRPIDLLLTDVVMPKLGGVELARRLSARRVGLRVIYMSGYTDGAVGRHGVLEKGVTLLEKPFSGERLAILVREELDRARGG